MCYLGDRPGLHVDAHRIRKIARQRVAHRTRRDDLVAGQHKAGLRVLRLVARGAEQHLADRRVRLDEADPKARDDAPGIRERAGVDVVLDGAARDDDTAAARSAVDRTGQADRDHAPWLENIAGVLGSDRRGDLAYSGHHDHEAAALPRRDPWAHALRARHPAHEGVRFLLERGDDCYGAGVRHATSRAAARHSRRGAPRWVCRIDPKNSTSGATLAIAKQVCDMVPWSTPAT